MEISKMIYLGSQNLPDWVVGEEFNPHIQVYFNPETLEYFQIHMKSKQYRKTEPVVDKKAYKFLPNWESF
jgi:hypothetical protein